MNIFIRYINSRELYEERLSAQRKAITAQNEEIYELNKQIELLKKQRNLDKYIIKRLRNLLFLASFVIMLLGLAFNLK